MREAVVAFAPEVLIDELTDLPDDAARIPEFRVAQNRIRRQGIRNLLAAARVAGVTRVLSQSIPWPLEGDAQAAVEEHERLVPKARGVILRYGQLYGPGTFYEHQPPAPPRVHINEAARRTVLALECPPGTVELILD